MTIEDFKKDGEMIKNEAVRRLFENETPYVTKDGNNYDVHAVNLHFTCCYADEEIEKMADLCLELMEELRRINEAGYTRKEFLKAEKSGKGDKESITHTISVYNSFATDKIDEIIVKLAEAARVGGAYFMVIAKPVFISGILSVLSVILDYFNEADLYFSALFMLLRQAMHMHGDEIGD